MKPFPDRTAMALEWIQPRTFDRYFELRAGNDLLGTLCWGGMLSNLAAAETVYGSWTLEQIGILSQRVEVREAGTERLAATYYPKLMGNGVLEFVDGRVLEWEPTNFWSTDWSFFDEADNPSVALAAGGVDTLSTGVASSARSVLDPYATAGSGCRRGGYYRGDCLRPT
jgi:hypothetical protein